MKVKAKLFILGLVLGICAAFPIGFNFGRGEPVLSNPFAKAGLREQVVERVKTSTDTALEGARETIHEATRPLAQSD
jgi:hypothetical protein